MDKKSKIFFIVFFLLIIGSIVATYWRIVVKKDYIIEAQTDCDPETEECFIWECDPNSNEEGEACVEDPEENIWYYKVVQRKANKIPDYDPEKDENCEPWICEPEEKDCKEILCDEETAIEQEAECNDPEEYLRNNSPEESEGEGLGEEQCGEGDEACLEQEEQEEDIETENSGEESQINLFPTGDDAEVDADVTSQTENPVESE